MKQRGRLLRTFRVASKVNERVQNLKMKSEESLKWRSEDRILVISRSLKTSEVDASEADSSEV